MDPEEFQNTYIDEISKKNRPKDEKVPNKQDNITYIEDDALKTTVGVIVKENTSCPEVVQVDENSKTGSHLNGSELSEGRVPLECCKKDEQDIVTGDLVSNTTRDALETEGQGNPFKNQNTYIITSEHIESILCKNTFMGWPELIKRVISSIPIQSSDREFGGVARASQKDVFEGNTLQDLSPVVQICETVQLHDLVEAAKNDQNFQENDLDSPENVSANERRAIFFNGANENFITLDNADQHPSEPADVEEKEAESTKQTPDFALDSLTPESRNEHVTKRRNTGSIARVAHFFRSKFKFRKARKFYRGDRSREDSQKKKSSSA